MGIPGLQSFMERDARLSYRVSIPDLVARFRAETGGGSGLGVRPVIAVDASSCLRPLYQGLDWLCGGQFIEFRQRILHFVNAFEKIGVELVFFFDGPSQENKLDTWIHRRCENFYRIQNLFIHINRGADMREEPQLLLPTGLSTFMRLVLLSETSCRLVVCQIEADEEIARFARLTPECMAVMGQDTDFVIFNAARHYLSSTRFDTHSMTTIEYDSEALAAVARIPTELLPVLGTILGNDVLPQGELHAFHRRLLQKKTAGLPRGKEPRLHEVMPHAANFIKTRLDVRAGVDKLAAQLAVEMFGKKCPQLREKTGWVLDSLSTYKLLHRPTSQAEDKSELLGILQSDPICSSIASEVIVHRTVMHSNALEDLHSRCPASCLVYRPLMVNLYRLLLEEQPEVEWVTEYAVHAEHSCKEPERVAVPRGRRFGLVALLKDKASVRSQSELLRILLWVVGADVTQEVHSAAETLLLRIEPEFRLPALVLFYLHRTQRLLAAREVSVLLHMMLVLFAREYTPAAGERLAHPDPDCVQLATLFTRGVSHVTRVVAVLGRRVLEPVCWDRFFDGVLLQRVFSGTAAPPTPHSEPARVLHANLRNFVLGCSS